MANELWALLVYDEEEPIRALERILLDQGISTRHARYCAEARAALQQADQPVLVLTDTSLPDGTWADVLQAASTGPASSPVIVMSRVVDIPLYLDVIESGAYDFVVPPLAPADLAHIVSGAVLKARSAALASFSKTGKESRLRGR